MAMSMVTMNVSSAVQGQRKSGNENIQAYVRVRPINERERGIRSFQVVDVVSPREVVTRNVMDLKLTKKFTFDRAFGPESRQVDVYTTVVAPLIEEVLAGYNCTVFAYGQTGTGKTHTMVGTECAELKSSWEDDSEIGIIPRALSHLFDELRLMELEFTMRISYLELYNEELCDLLSTDDSGKIRIFDDATKKGSVIIQGLEEIPVHSKDDVYKLLEKGKERRRTAKTLMNAQSSRSHTVFSIVVHIRENGIDGEEMLKIGKLNLVDLAGSENAMKAGNEGIRVRETASINQSLLTLGRVITALVERTPHVPYRESKLTRLLQESLGGRTKTSIIATISPGHKDIEETLSTLLYADRAKNIQNKPEANQKLTKRTMIKEYTEEIDKLKRDLIAAREKNGIYLAEETYFELTSKMDAQNRELNEKVLLLKALKDEMQNKERLFNDLSLNLVDKTAKLECIEKHLEHTKGALFETKKVLNTTKRRFKEKKTLLECHVQTEKALTEQATQILEVAEVATKDTHQLHSAIERRRDVDRHNEVSCQLFTERMRENFKILDNQFEALKKAHNPKVDLVNQELENIVKCQNSLLNNSKMKINELRHNLKEFAKESTAQEMKFSNILKELSMEHRDELLRLFSDQKSTMLNQKETIEKSLNEIMANNTAQASVVKNIKEKSLNVYEQCFGDVRSFTDGLRGDMSNCLLTLKSFMDVTMKLRNQVLEEYDIIENERQIRERERENRLKRMAQTEEYLKKLEMTRSQYETELSMREKCTETFCNDQESKKNKFIPDIKAEFDRFLSINVKNNVEDNQAQERNSLFYTDNVKQIDAAIECCNRNYKKIEESTQTRHSAVTNRHAEYSILLDNACTSIDGEVSEGVQGTWKDLAIASSINTDLQRMLNEYGGQHKVQLEKCASEVDKLKKQEIKTYTSTGATPSKKVFAYPRVLAVTSPDNTIIKRIRQENEWSDLDTTATIDEEEILLEEDTENLLVNDENASGIILNSTTLTPVQNNSKNHLSISNTPIKSVLKEINSEKNNSAVSSL